MKLYYAGYQPEAKGFGWATANSNLTRELGKLCQLTGEDEADVIFQPIVDHALRPFTQARAKVNIGYTFFESPLESTAELNAQFFDLIFCGSSWCKERLAERGIDSKVLIQGVDTSIFRAKPPRRTDSKFRIFSGGKFEIRKGQDLVIAAFAKFKKVHPDAHLTCSWYNPWQQIVTNALEILGWPGTLEAELAKRLSSGSFTLLPGLSQTELAPIMSNTDVGLFPNRCEGGTNLVLMEYASCARKVIANKLTGHRDIAEAIHYHIPAKEDENGWAEQSVDDIVTCLEKAYLERDMREHWSMSAHRQWSWATPACKIVDEAERLIMATHHHAH